MINKKIILPGGAGLVGQNLIVRLLKKGYNNLVVLDKHEANLALLKRLHPEITAEYADLAEQGSWAKHFVNANTVVMLQAQIGAKDQSPFIRNNIESTQNILKVIQKSSIEQLIHISSSVVESVADDHYTQTKAQQEALVVESGVNSVVLRPTLMFGWFDRKHLGWLSRFMQKVPVFPIPGNGKFMRQPLYAGDFSNLIISCIENNKNDGVYNITGLEKIDYIDIIRSIKQATAAKAFILKIPFRLFWVLLKVWSLFDSKPPFTTQQLEALIADDEFEVIDWPQIFSISPTPLDDAIKETFCHDIYSKIELEF